MSEDSSLQNASGPSPDAESSAAWTAELIRLFAPLALSQNALRIILEQQYDIKISTYRLLTWLKGATSPLDEESQKILTALKSLNRRKKEGEDLKRLKTTPDIWVEPHLVDEAVSDWLSSGLTLQELAVCSGLPPTALERWADTARVRKSDWAPAKALLDGITAALRLTRNTEPPVSFKAWLATQNVEPEIIRLLLGMTEKEFSVYQRTDKIRPSILRQGEAIVKLYQQRQADLGFISTDQLVAELMKRHPKAKVTLNPVKLPKTKETAPVLVRNAESGQSLRTGVRRRV